MPSIKSDDHRDIPRGCSDPSAGAVFFAKLMRLDAGRAFRALREDPAVMIEVGSLVLPPAVGLVAGAVLFQRQRASWAARDFSNKVNVALYSFREKPSAAAGDNARPLMVVRTLSEKRVEDLVTNKHGRSELADAAKRHLCGKHYIGLVHMEPRAARLWSNILLNAMSEQFAAGALHRDLGVPGVRCARYGLGLVSSIGYEGGTKMRAMLISEATLRRAVELAAIGSQPLYEIPGHHVAFPLVLRLAEALEVKPAPSSGVERQSSALAAGADVEGARPLVIPPASAVGSPVATWVELCGAGA